MQTKLIMRWDVRKETESEYFEFLVHEFIPGLNRLGIDDIQVWYTAYGKVEQKLASGIAPSADHMNQMLGTEEWLNLVDRLRNFVEDYSQKVIPATRGFQL
ncbi:MAG: hypothetical protein KC415_11880 [Anaerolineales bacterium]|nr:hypothetical protein [Anaerolineales bacterium]MCB8991439.1 hypothetical protein [Ardenticatenaceae bacterium]MCB9003941.1 hypothetical protein [Ardenticatenaceae bacterium]